MKRFLISVLFLGLFLAISSSEEPPKLESLYADSDPNLSWPPVGKSFNDSDKDVWPGEQIPVTRKTHFKLLQFQAVANG